MIVCTVNEATLFTKSENAEERIPPQSISDIGYNIFHSILNS